MRTLGENVRTGSDHVYTQQAVEWKGKSPERNCKHDQLMLLTNLYKYNFPPESNVIFNDTVNVVLRIK